ncbi:hypothetical protein CL652_03250 [bacterium]|nr:hypothetical protein [bacterium]|tara:strand:- start:21121 stop:22311 length:1191 start_codon:yes stop_codon:yes gene_type:complete
MDFLPFFLVLLVGIVFSSVFRRFHLPWVVALMMGGIIVGPYGVGWVETTDTISFLGQVGLVLLMFMAGLETKLSSFEKLDSNTIALALVNGLLPFGVGFGIGLIFEFGFVPSALLGIVFVSSSIAVIVPTLESRGVLGSRLGRTILSAAIIEDVASLIFLSILFQTIEPTTSLPLPVFYLLLFAVLVTFRRLLPVLQLFFSPSDGGPSKDIFQRDVRVIFVLLTGTVISFELLGLHPIIAGFFAGLVLSDSIRSEVLIEKLRTLSYGVFIPIFFVVLGMETDISVFSAVGGAIVLTGAVLLGSILSKFISGWLGGRIAGFRGRESLVVGAATIPQLSTTLAVVFSGLQSGLFDQRLVAAMIVLSIVTTVLAPMLITYFMAQPKIQLSRKRFGEPRA